MEARIALRLPRDASSVPFIRQLVDAALRTLGVVPPIRDDIRIILSEACSNVIRHAAPSEEYTVSAALDEDHCVIKIVDHGTGFDPNTVDRSPANGISENGRGLQIMRALADDVHITTFEEGSEVSVEKALRYVEDAPGRTLQHSLSHH
ncbi:ATP-binding protein [Spongiactinospora sp. TRM90649]|uniref:ATP-binding protein n=1 Tax=Spongiactinospora sp. TRM90649 TaxID=3031114 RepID=UPI0023F7C03C|nr:ATP-binding protein [Spongiactinospora sp. TRM90649]MDF5757129.1 ATP-binding protein [Spongiactinospora sp. TRM90649]